MALRKLRNNEKGIPGLIRNARLAGWTKEEFEAYIRDNYEQILIEEYPTTAEFLHAMYSNLSSSFGAQMMDDDMVGLVLNVCADDYEFSYDRDDDDLRDRVEIRQDNDYFTVWLAYQGWTLTFDRKTYALLRADEDSTGNFFYGGDFMNAYPSWYDLAYSELVKRYGKPKRR